jgi:DNA-binding beta-propeller fold protein YncE
MPFDVEIDASGTIYIADTHNHRIRQVSPEGVITTVAGIGEPDFSGDGGLAVQASLNMPYGIALDGSGSLYVADSENHRVRKISAEGIITTIAGSGVIGDSGDGGLAIKAQLNSPQELFITSQNEILVVDEHNHKIRKIVPAGIIDTVAGTGEAGFSGDGGAATDARLNDPEDIWGYPSGEILIVDGDNKRVRKIDKTGRIKTLIGHSPF